MNTSKYSDDVIIQNLINYVQGSLDDKVDKETFPYTNGGSFSFEHVPAPSIQTLGKVYNIIDDFITTNDFVEGPDIPCMAGTDIAVVRITNSSPVEYKYNIFGGSVVSGGDAGNYNQLTNKPKINGVTIIGDKSPAAFGLAEKSEIPANVSDLQNDAGFITQSDIPTDVSAFNNDAGYLTDNEIRELEPHQMNQLLNLL